MDVSRVRVTCVNLVHLYSSLAGITVNAIAVGSFIDLRLWHDSKAFVPNDDDNDDNDDDNNGNDGNDDDGDDGNDIHESDIDDVPIVVTDDGIITSVRAEQK